MKQIFVEKVTHSIDSSFFCNILEFPYFPRPLHVHPEYELILLEKGDGMAFVGDMTCPIKPGMFMLIGRNLPHFWLSSQAYYKPNSSLISKCIYSQFSTNIFPQNWEQLPEFQTIYSILTQSKRGILFNGCGINKIRERFCLLPSLQNFDKLLELYHILYALSMLKDNQCMSSSSYEGIFNFAADPIIQKTQNYLNTHYNEKINLAKIADTAGMNATALCRHYKKHIGKTIFQHLAELRISYATKLLLNKNLSINQIAYDCGYTSISHFNEQFKNILGKTPREYTKGFNYNNINP